MPIPSLFIGAGGVTSQQNAISVVSNNIANVNTTAFKSSKAYFQDQVYNVINGASSPTLTLGGKNPNEFGMGNVLSSVSTVFSQGAFKSTGIATDLAISGQGFFVVSGSSTEGEGLSSPVYSRDGHFTFDTEGTLVNSSGQKVFGVTFYDPTNNRARYMSGYTGVTFHSDQPIGPSDSPTFKATDGSSGNLAVPTPTEAAFVGGTAPNFDATKIAELSVRGGVLEDTGVDTGTLGDITISRTADGKMRFSFDDASAGTAASTYTVDVDTNKSLSDGVVSFEMQNTAGDLVQMRIRLKPGVTSLEDVFTSVDYDSGTGTSDTILFAGTAATTQGGTDITVGADDIEFMSTTNVRALLEPIKVPPELYTVDTDEDYQVGTASFTIEADGTVTIVGAGSEKMKLGRLAIGNFKNPDGLSHLGGNNYVESSNSGAAALTVLGGPFDSSAPTVQGSSIVSGALEGSNVNLSNEFSELIALQRGLQASAKTITTSDEILQTLIDL